MGFSDILVLALKSLTDRVILILALFMSCGLFSWAMMIDTVLSLSVACAFSVLVFLPILLSMKHGKKETVSDDV
jgi:hypothetical protein